jgi:hypothetical protein
MDLLELVQIAALGRSVHQLVAKRPQGARVVDEVAGPGWTSGGSVGRGHHLQVALSGGLDPLPLGESTLSQAMSTYL